MSKYNKSNRRKYRRKPYSELTFEEKIKLFLKEEKETRLELSKHYNRQLRIKNKYKK